MRASARRRTSRRKGPTGFLLTLGVLGAHSPLPGQNSIVNLPLGLEYLDSLRLNQQRYDLVEARPVDPMEVGL